MRIKFIDESGSSEKMDINMNRFLTACVYFIGFSVLLLIGTCNLMCYADNSGKSQAKATQEAKEFTKLDYPNATVFCDGGEAHGYVSCLVIPSKEDGRKQFALECTPKYTLRADGCRLTPILVEQK